MWCKTNGFGLLLGVCLSLLMGLSSCTCCDVGPISLPLIRTTLPNNRLIFPPSKLEQKQTRTFQVYNGGDVPLVIEEIYIEGKESHVYTLTDLPKLPITLQHGKENGVTLRVQSITKTEGVFQGQLVLKAPISDNVNAQGRFVVYIRNEILAPYARFMCGHKLDFGFVEKGQTKTLTCDVANIGTADLVIQGVHYVSDIGSNHDFHWVDKPRFPIVVPTGGKQVQFSVAYNPSDFSPLRDQGFFKFKSNSPSMLTLSVSGRTAVPAVKLVPLFSVCKTNEECFVADKRLYCGLDTFDGTRRCVPQDSDKPFVLFPLTGKGKATVRTFAIRSVGQLPLRVDSIKLNSSTSNEFRVIGGDLFLPFTLPPKKQKVVQVEYTPTDDDGDKGHVVVAHNVPNIPQATIALDTSQSGCDLEVKPRKHVFPNLVPPLTVNIRNRGDKDCILKKVWIKSQSMKDTFALVPTPSPEQIIVPGGRLDFLVTFRPNDALSRFQGIVSIASTDTDEPIIDIELEGRTGGGGCYCKLMASTRTVSFGVVGVGHKKQIFVDLSNEGWRSCKIQSLEVLGTLPAGHNSFQLGLPIKLPLNLDSGSSIRVPINFVPTYEQRGFEGKVVVHSNDRSGPAYSINLVGSSAELCLDIKPRTVDFGTARFACSTQTMSIQIKHRGLPSCPNSISIKELRLSQGTSSEFRILYAPSVPITILAGQSLTIRMSYKPKTVGVDTGKLELKNNVAGQSTMFVDLVGEGVSTHDQKDVFVSSSSGVQNRFHLRRQSNEGTIVVKVNGLIIKQHKPTGWQYDKQSNSILFGKSAIPKAGSVIQVEYKAVCFP